MREKYCKMMVILVNPSIGGWIIEFSVSFYQIVVGVAAHDIKSCISVNNFTGMT